jgi:hypothetical protein
MAPRHVAFLRHQFLPGTEEFEMNAVLVDADAQRVAINRLHERFWTQQINLQ